MTWESINSILAFKAMLGTQVFGRVDKKSFLVFKGIVFTLLDLKLIMLSFKELGTKLPLQMAYV